MSHFARDQSIWNQLVYGRSRTPVVDQLSEEQALGAESNISGSRYSDNPDEKSSHAHSQCAIEQDDIFDEKIGLKTELPIDLEAGPRSKHEHTGKRSSSQCVVSCIIVVTILYTLMTSHFGAFVAKPHFLGMRQRLPTFADSGSYKALGKERQEIIEVSYPFVPKPSYGKPVYSKLLIDYTFDSWGNPSLEYFEPPTDVDFNKVVLTLNTTVSGVQFDRLAHLYVGGAEIWRTSTMEPGGRLVFSSFKKDVSPYITLFQKKTPVLFQLDNLVVDGLDGKFHVKLQADFYSSASFHSVDPIDPEPEMYQYFDIRKDADHVYPLNAKKNPKKLPIEYVPSQKFKVDLPKVNHNTTRLKLAIFASANGHEEFWYNNVLDKFKHQFEDDGTEFYGHGPLRFVNIWVDGKKIASQSPQPFLFTGGYSPSLWSPVVAINAFDLPSIDLDISPLLPLLWKSGEHKLEILVDNGIDDFEGGNSGIGNDWILSANLLAYENSNIKKSKGKILNMKDSNSGHSTGVSIPYTKSLQQVVTGKYTVDFSSEMLLELKNGDLLNVTVESDTVADSSNVQSYSYSGYTGNIVHSGTSIKNFSLRDNFNNLAILHETTVKIELPLVLHYKEMQSKKGFKMNYDIVLAKEIDLDIDGEKIMTEASSQNGTSTLIIGDNGNYGTSALTTKYKSVLDGANIKFVYKRRVDAADGKIVSDEESFKH